VQITKFSELSFGEMQIDPIRLQKEVGKKEGWDSN